ncbi:MAG TPA: response regulator [Steroidobacteraceae bacterium]|nr:response regulator [Steroidobacteraceae bacterium]
MDVTLNGRRVLVVEDEFLIAIDLCHTLGKQGATVVGPIPSVQDALQLLDSLGQLDVAILDVNLNGQAVFPLAEMLAERKVPYIFTTGYDKLGLPERYRRVPMCSKPVQIETIVETVRQQLQ